MNSQEPKSDRPVVLVWTFLVSTDSQHASTMADPVARVIQAVKNLGLECELVVDPQGASE